MTLITALKYKNKIYYMENILDDNDIQVIHQNYRVTTLQTM